MDDNGLVEQTSEQSPSTAATGASAVRQGARVTIIGGGPGGYEAALVAAKLGAHVTLVESRGLGGNAVLTDVVPSKTLIATAEWLTITERAPRLGITVGEGEQQAHVDLAAVNRRVRELAAEQSQDIAATMRANGITVIAGRGRLGSLNLDGTRNISITTNDGENYQQATDVVLLAVGAQARELEQARPDGKRIFTWTQLYNLTELPEHLIVVGSGVTGAEFAGAYQVLGSQVTLVSSRDRVLPTCDADAATVVENEFLRRGMEVLSNSRAVSAEVINAGQADEQVAVTLADGRVIHGSHCLVAVGAIPATADLGLEAAGVETEASGHIRVDRVSRTTASRVYAAGDCTGVLPLASVAAMQGRTAMRHALGDALTPLNVSDVAQAVFTAPEIASIGLTEKDLANGLVHAEDLQIRTLPLSGNPRAKMLGIKDGFVKLLADQRTGVILGGVVVAPRASELILPVALAVTHRLTVEQMMGAFTIYPSLSGTISETARQLHTA